jgi:hypothetical protein
LPLWLVHVPAGSTKSSQFAFARATHRRLEFPGSSQHGILQGCVPAWTLTSEATDNPAKLESGEVHRVVIDGELLSFTGINVTAELDTAYPTVTAVGTTHDVPHYLYLVGGRHAPQINLISGYCAPVRLVQTVCAPDRWGRPIAALTVRGETIPVSACVYIGVGYMAAGTANRKGCVIDGDWVYAMTVNHAASACDVTAGFNEPDVDPGAGGFIAMTINSAPARATMVDLVASVLADAAPTNVTYELYSCSPSGATYNQRIAHRRTSEQSFHMSCRCAVKSVYYLYNAAGGFTANLRAAGYNMLLPRISR